MKTIFDKYTITDNKESASAEEVKVLLDGSYWAPDRELSLVQKTIDNSICVFVLKDSTLVGFARAVTDQAVFAWIADLIVHENHRGQGLAKAIMSFIQQHPAIPPKLQLLKTKDAHGLYEQYGFKRNSEFMCR